MKTTHLSVGLALLAATPFAAVLNPRASEARTPAAAEDPALERLIVYLDRDGDGRIGSFEGADALLLLVDEADTGGDGAVDAGELRAFLEGEFEDSDGLEGFRRELQEFLESVDADGDGAFALTDLPEEERDGFAPEFREADRDGDGRVTLAELEAVYLPRPEDAARFDVRGDTAVMNGVIGPSTPGRVLELVLAHPNVRRIVLEDVPGSMDDDANLRAARLVHRTGIATHVADGAEIASGGVDFFLAGVERSIGRGARLGVHSWGYEGYQGGDLPRDDPQHDLYLDFYRDVAIDVEFYWYTLEAAPAEGIHWMTPAEIDAFDVVTGVSGSDGDDSSNGPDSDDGLIGGAVQRSATHAIPENLRAVSDVRPSEHPPFAKELNACGIVLAAEKAVADEFLEHVGRAVAEIFDPNADGIDRAAQDRVLEHLHAYGTLLPVPRTEGSLDRLLDAEAEAFERLMAEHSICDIIMAEVPQGQVMEVVEHLLHAITDVGLHYAYPDEWGLSRDSALGRAMDRAIEAGTFDISTYDDLDGAPREVADRVLLQEFAYWFITTAWDLQVPYGPGEDEWTLRTPAELRAAFPEFIAIYDRTVGPTLRSPSLDTLRAIGPRRDEE